jgi:hypothetical protein
MVCVGPCDACPAQKKGRIACPLTILREVPVYRGHGDEVLQPLHLPGDERPVCLKRTRGVSALVWPRGDGGEGEGEQEEGEREHTQGQA